MATAYQYLCMRHSLSVCYIFTKIFLLTPCPTLKKAAMFIELLHCANAHLPACSSGPWIVIWFLYLQRPITPLADV
jgi:hypothetical protein